MISKSYRHVLPVLALAALLPARALAAGDTQFVRVAADGDERPVALQMAIASYAPRGGNRQARVDLVSAIHIGDQAYYRQLNERFKTYDALLYELIAARDAVVAPGDSDRRGIVSSTQVMMKNALDLSFQLDEIDYGAGNFVHADLSPDELSQSMDERGESLYVYFWRLFYASVNQYAKDPLGLKDMQNVTAALQSNSDNALKVMLAYEMTDLETMREIFGEDADSAVIGARNQRAVDVLKSQLAAGKKRIAIFYGVAHMPDLEDRLIEQLDFEYLESTWIDAWRLND